jgi:hypothetical protein
MRCVRCVELETIAAGCPCPAYQQRAERVHSRYWRTIVDLPWAKLVVRPIKPEPRMP